MIASIDIFEALKTKFGEAEAKIIVKELEKIDASVETRVDKKFEEAKTTLATKEDVANSRAEIIKWMFIFWASQLIAMITFLKLFK